MVENHGYTGRGESAQCSGKRRHRFETSGRFDTAILNVIVLFFLELPCYNAISAVSTNDTKVRPVTSKPITGEELLSVIRLLASFLMTCYKD
jgi:hypothetical protein